MRITLSVVKSYVGGYVGNTGLHPRMMEVAEDLLKKEMDKNTIVDFQVLRVGSGIVLIISHKMGTSNQKVNKLFSKVLSNCARAGRELGMYMSPLKIGKNSMGISEIEIEERKSEPVIIFLSTDITRGIWNLPVARIFASPFFNKGLFPSGEFTVEIGNSQTGKKAHFKIPDELGDVLFALSRTEQYEIKAVIKNRELVAVSGMDSALIVRAGENFPLVGKILESFAAPLWVVNSWDGVSIAIPVPFHQANPLRSGGPVRIIAAGFQLTEGLIVGPRDLFDDPGFEPAREKAIMISDFINQQGPFGLGIGKEPKISKALKRIEGKFKKEY